jgi:hypothetical protein
MLIAPGTAPEKRKILFFTRGRGRGHAVRDLAILAELRRQAPHIESVFVSYAAGASTLAEAGLDVIDLKLADDAPFLEVVIRVTRVLAKISGLNPMTTPSFRACSQIWRSTRAAWTQPS